MHAFRHQIRRHPTLVALLVAAAMLLRIVVPAGFMPGFSSGTITIVLCTGDGPATMAMAMPGGDHKSGNDQSGKSELPCSFAGLSAPGLSATDPVQLALALLVIVATALFAAPPSVIAPPARLRPPLRGPPAAA